MTFPIAEVALPIPKRALFDYSLAGFEHARIGARVMVSFGRRQLIGVIAGIKAQSGLAPEKLKAISALLDQESVFSEAHLTWLQWASQYYQHAFGEVLANALPVNLRKGAQAGVQEEVFYKATSQGQSLDDAELKRAPRQLAALQVLRQSQRSAKQLKDEFGSAVVNALLEKGLIESQCRTPEPDLTWPKRIKLADKPRPNLEQSLCITAIYNSGADYQCHLLEGVTGSGKTEVYLQAIEPLLLQGKQILVLVPEIGLTPQTVKRFEDRFGLKAGLLHSGLADGERLRVWQQARSGELGLIIGTRSAVFTPMKSPGMIIVDEEHDASYKQQDGWRYHARDLAVVRARLEKIPLLLGSATPSLESLNNALTGKYRHHLLRQRAGIAKPVHHSILDMKGQALDFGLARGLQGRIRQHLSNGHQVMLFINRRGYAPALICHQCGHVESCLRCDRSYTLHRGMNKLQCHHCGDAKSIPQRCPACSSDKLQPVGLGTEQLEDGLKTLFPGVSAVRIDSDSARGKDKLDKLLQAIDKGEHQLLIGTQILAKGHHFPNVSMVVVLDVDSALFSADFRAAEKLAQLITQVAGRAGRAHIQGELWLQTHHPGHPLLQDLLHNGYQHFARLALQERRFIHLPPFSYQGLFRVEANDARQAFDFLCQVREQIPQYPDLHLIGPLPALMEKRQGRFRMQLLLQSGQRTGIQQALAACLEAIEGLPLANRVRWSVDLDPQDFT
ncbi:primosomal protein N' [Aliiglaciecola sp. CAU 1673]|uniref:primosomal protein N' n=1 Tax=Aliiglaciecola sp. CAU 1673 TaxID=3032595 RepID=UPI0023DA07C2|nr:primosomal protein N' [Aliiglaciecola sp. CAU 1673]MDF2180110.1 primosomal protein N' [Aliiglaciecola sp. CAU 1673]